MPATKRKPAVKNAARKSSPANRGLRDAKSRIATEIVNSIVTNHSRPSPFSLDQLEEHQHPDHFAINEQQKRDAEWKLLGLDRRKPVNDGSKLRETLKRYRHRYFPESAAPAPTGPVSPGPTHIGISGLTSDIVARLHNILDKEGDLQQIEALVTRVTGLTPPPSAVTDALEAPMPEAVSARLHTISDLLQRVENRLGGLMHNLGEAL